MQQRSRAAGKHRHVGAANDVAELEGVADGVLQADIAGGDGQGDHVMPFIGKGHQQGQGVVHTGVGVDQQGDLVGHRCRLQIGNEVWTGMMTVATTAKAGFLWGWRGGSGCGGRRKPVPGGLAAASMPRTDLAPRGRTPRSDTLIALGGPLCPVSPVVATPMSSSTKPWSWPSRSAQPQRPANWKCPSKRWQIGLTRSVLAGR
ncbi:hypothetical protein G6F23_013599 [Rhizopus arrhizus]|nr:hypothetical protein G6F23_013599 [Rhizopus arrhizus]